MGHENGDKQRPTKRRHVQGMLDETEPLNNLPGNLDCRYESCIGFDEQISLPSAQFIVKLRCKMFFLSLES